MRISRGDVRSQFDVVGLDSIEEKNRDVLAGSEDDGNGGRGHPKPLPSQGK